MTNPSPIALAIATALEAALTPIMAALTAPIIDRIGKLEAAYTPDDAAFDAAVITAIRNQPATVVDFLGKEIDHRTPTDEFIEKAISTVLASSEFDTAVLGVIEDRAEEVVSNLGDDLTDKINEVRNEVIANTVSDVLRRRLVQRRVYEVLNMSTRSRIGILNPDATITSVYCHNDGYIEGVGTTLTTHYTDEAKIRALIDLGDLSSVGPPAGVLHSFSNPILGVTVAYGRDRGEKGCFARTDKDFDAFMRSPEEYTYLWSGYEWLAWHGRTPLNMPVELVTVRIAS